jgi:hypothetical protein
MAIESLATESFLSSKFMAVAGSLVIGACLTFSPSPYDTARGDSTASARSHVSNTASKGDRLTSRHSDVSARAATRPEQIIPPPSGKIPAGCEPVFSKLAHWHDLSARRCIT